MQQFTPQGQELINNMAQRYNVSYDAVVAMLDAVMRGNGSMAQFNIPELGGSGQWMMGGMTMVGDMFNSGLQSTVDNLCVELSNLLANQPATIFQPAPAQSQMQSGMNANTSSNGESVSLFVNNNDNNSMSNSNWWPDELGMAASTGGQNNVRYAYFPDTQRLAIEINGQVTLYDALDHQISGFSQQQGGNDSLSFYSQYGLVAIASLPMVNATDKEPSTAEPESESVATEQAHPTLPGSEGMDIFSMIEQLGMLREKGILTDEEFTSKKTELLSKL